MNLLTMFEKTAEKYFDKIAVMDSDKKLTFDELKGQAKKLACVFIRKKIINSPICIFAYQNVETIIELLAVLYSGNYFIMLDPESPRERIEKIISESKSKYSINKSSAGEYDNLICVEDSAFAPTSQELKELENIYPNIASDSAAYVVYTSGSTGIPKGVLKSHKSLLTFATNFAEKFEISSDDVFGNQAPFYFDASMKDVLMMIGTGASICIIPKKLFMFPLKLVDLLNQEKISVLMWVPSALSIFAQLKVFDKLENPLPHIKKVLFVGEVFPIKYLNYWISHLPKVEYYNIYGASETAGVVCYYQVKNLQEETMQLPIGKPLPMVDTFILNDDDKICEKGEIGELCISGGYLASGYYNNKVETEKKFTYSSINGCNRLIYRTGDLVILNEYEDIVFQGRKDFQIKHMGHRIELGEIEAAILSLSYVKEACVVYNDIALKIMAYVSLCDGSSMDIKKTIKGDLGKMLPSYMIPVKIEILEELKKNRSFKIDRKYYKDLCKE